MRTGRQSGGGLAVTSLGRSRRSAVAAAAVVLTVLVVFAVGACGGDDGESTSELSAASTNKVIAVGSTTTTTGAPTGDGSEATAGGTRREPVPVGQEAKVGNWRVRVTDVSTDATQAILDENMFNDPPGPDDRYVLITVEATYVGEDVGTFWIDILSTFVGDEGDTFSLASVVPPTPITDTSEVAGGEAVSGNVVFAVASKQIAGGTLMLQDLLSREGGRVFFAID
ncbi:MAG: hypothetical protein JW990_13855 [Thermoleophilia bacterium]|nr:hypothetical protein [Thermoleophilia bacterium]